MLNLRVRMIFRDRNMKKVHLFSYIFGVAKEKERKLKKRSDRYRDRLWIKDFHDNGLETV